MHVLYRWVVLAFILFTVVLTTFPLSVLADAETERLAENFKIGETKYEELRQWRDRMRDNIRRQNLSPERKQRMMHSLTNAYQRKSRALVHQYREPFMRKVISNVKTRLPRGSNLNDSIGTSLYVTDKNNNVVTRNGEPVLNASHRGWDGDTDLGGDLKAVAELEKEFKKYDVSVTNGGHRDKVVKKTGETVSVGTFQDDSAGYRDFKRTEVTINISDKLGRVGDSSHQTQVEVHARSKETYVSASMNRNQPGKAAVEVNDHYKKAARGLKTSPMELLQPRGEDALQGLAKGTLKSASTAQLSDGDLGRILTDVGYDGSVEDYKASLKKLKEGHIAEGAGVNEQNVAKWKEATSRVLKEARSKTRTDADSEMANMRDRIHSLEAQAKSGELSPERAESLKKRALVLREYMVDSKVKLDATDKATHNLMTGQSHQPPFAGSSSSKVKTVDEISPKADVQGLKGKIAKVGPKIFDLADIVENTMNGVNQALDEEKPGDSGVLTWLKATGYGVWNASGIPDMAELTSSELKSSMDKTFKKINELANPKDGRQVGAAELVAKGTWEWGKGLLGAVGNMGKTMAKGFVEGMYDMAAKPGQWLGEMSADQDPEANEDVALRTEAQLIKARMAKTKEMMDDIGINERETKPDQSIAYEQPIALVEDHAAKAQSASSLVDDGWGAVDALDDQIAVVSNEQAAWRARQNIAHDSVADASRSAASVQSRGQQVVQAHRAEMQATAEAMSQVYNSLAQVQQQYYQIQAQDRQREKELKQQQAQIRSEIRQQYQAYEQQKQSTYKGTDGYPVYDPYAGAAMAKSGAIPKVGTSNIPIRVSGNSEPSNKGYRFKSSSKNGITEASCGRPKCDCNDMPKAMAAAFAVKGKCMAGTEPKGSTKQLESQAINHIAQKAKQAGLKVKRGGSGYGFLLSCPREPNAVENGQGKKGPFFRQVEVDGADFKMFGNMRKVTAKGNTYYVSAEEAPLFSKCSVTRMAKKFSM